jgi:hypothetical protein
LVDELTAKKEKGNATNTATKESQRSVGTQSYRATGNRELLGIPWYSQRKKESAVDFGHLAV